ncbi:MAG: hypothetical protein KF787_00420 [Phycisphaeraceae bacterium]|nr:hypothetical protein [Phycisphaerae bacterium]MBX3391086.1 hypothetical protein [Phycisphaeraceae bacterium]
MTLRSSISRLERRTGEALGKRGPCGCGPPLVVTRWLPAGTQDPPEQGTATSRP